MERFVLDTWAVLSMFSDGPGSSQAAEAIETGAVISWMNLTEVDYIVRRRFGPQAADDAVADLRARVRADIPDVAAFRSAARIKAAMPMSLADAFAAGLALHLQLPLLTGDPELLRPVPQGLAQWRTVDLRGGTLVADDQGRSAQAEGRAMK